MQKWEYLKIHIMLEQGSLFSYQSQKIIDDREIMERINALGKSGWELVNVVEEVGNERDKNKSSNVVAALLDFAIAGPRVTTANQHKTVTLGYYLWFKRPHES